MSTEYYKYIIPTFSGEVFCKVKGVLWTIIERVFPLMVYYACCFVGRLERYCLYMYNNFECIYYITNMIVRFFSGIYNYMFGIISIPYERTWINISRIIPIQTTSSVDCDSDHYVKSIMLFLFNKMMSFIPTLSIKYSDKDSFTYNESYFGIGDEWSDIIDKIISVHNCLDMKDANINSNILAPNEDVDHLLTIARNNDYYNVRISTNTSIMSNTNCLIGNNYSKVKFISIQYSHPRMTNMIDIIILPGMYMVGNEILSSVFIFKWLVNNFPKNSYVFDKDYVVCILDNQIKYTEVRSNQFCIIKEKDWSVGSFD
jgi:hypothetical protein